MSFEESLSLLSSIVKKSRSKALKVAFVNYLNEFHSSMRDYIVFLEMTRGLQPKSQWDVEFVRRERT